MSVTGFFHAGVTVSDMDAALRFYRDGLGLRFSPTARPAARPPLGSGRSTRPGAGRLPERAGQ